jgi:hypothetical protein
VWESRYLVLEVADQARPDAEDTGVLQKFVAPDEDVHDQGAAAGVGDHEVQVGRANRGAARGF